MLVDIFSVHTLSSVHRNGMVAKTVNSDICCTVHGETATETPNSSYGRSRVDRNLSLVSGMQNYSLFDTASFEQSNTGSKNKQTSNCQQVASCLIPYRDSSHQSSDETGDVIHNQSTCLPVLKVALPANLNYSVIPKTMLAQDPFH